MSDATNIQVTLPTALAREAEENGLLAPMVLESLLRQELRRRGTEQLMAAADRLAALGDQPPTPAEIEAEIQAVRTERRRENARSRGH